MSDAFRNEFIDRTHLKLVNQGSEADSKIEGEIVGFKLTPVTYSADGHAQVYQVEITIKVTFINLKDNSIIFKKDNMSYSDHYSIEAGDSVSLERDAFLSISQKFASQTIQGIFTGIK